IVRLDEIANGLAKTGTEAVLVRSAGTGGNAVDVAAQVLVGRLRPLERDVEADSALVVFARERERRLVHRRCVPLGDYLLEIVDESFHVLEDDLLARALVFERDLHALVEVARHLEALLDDARIELDLGEDRRVGTEEHRRAGAARGAGLLHRAD